MYIGQCLLPDDRIKSLAKELSDDTTINLSYTDALSEIKDKFNVIFSELHIPEEIWNESFFEPYKDEILKRVKTLITTEGALIEYNFINNPKLKLEINNFLANKLIESFSNKVRESKNFKEDHIYEVKKDDKWVKADISVTSYAKEIKDEKDLNKAKPFKISQYKKEEVVPNAGMVIGNSFDSIARDFFSGEDITKKSYPNIDSNRLKVLKTELEKVKAEFDRIYKGNYKIIARPFPMVSTFTDSTGKKFTIAGETDLLVITSNGIKIYDFKVNSSKSDRELVNTYTNQLSLYKRIIKDEMPFLDVDTGGLIVADVNYYKTRGTLKIKDGIITYNNKNISSLKEEDYSIHIHQSTGFMQASPIVTIMYNKKVMDNIGKLSEADLEELNNIPMFGELKIDDLVKEAKKSKKKNKQEEKEESKNINITPTKFSTSSTNSYAQRTKENADWSDITIAFAVNFNTAGELATKRSAGNKYVAVGLSSNNKGDISVNRNHLDNVVKKYRSINKPIKLNIAGNGIYTFNKNTSQETINEKIQEAIEYLQSKGVQIESIRSGGQTGIDEAGIIAAQNLGIPSEVHTTSDYKFRGRDNKDILDEAAFKARFNVKETPKESVNEQKQWAKSSDNGYEVSSDGDNRFSAFNAKLKPGTKILGIEVPEEKSTTIAGKPTTTNSIEYVYQTLIKKSGKGKAPASDSILNINDYDPLYHQELGIYDKVPKSLRDKLENNFKLFVSDKPTIPYNKNEKEDYSYYIGYLTLWQEWASQNPELIEELRVKSEGKVLTDKFANTRVSQARALADILNEGKELSEESSEDAEDELVFNKYDLEESEESEEETEDSYESPFKELLEDSNTEEGSTDDVTVIDTTPNLLPVTSTEIIKCGQNVAKLAAYHIRCLQSNDNYREQLFGDEFDKGYFIGRSNSEIVKDTNAFNAILNYIKDDTFNIEDIDFDDPLYDKIDWVIDNWDSIIKAGFSTFIDVLKISVDASIMADDEVNNEDLNTDENEDSEDDERAAWSYDIREVSPSKSMNAQLKTLLSTIPEYSYTEGTDSEGNPIMISGELQYDDTALGSVKFLDRNTVIYTLYNELHSFNRFSKMKKALGSYELQSQYPWMQDIYDFLNENPHFQTLFFTTFRTNKLNYINTSVKEITKEDEDVLDINSYPLADNITYETLFAKVSDGINKGESELFTKSGNNGLSILNSEESERLFNSYDYIKKPRKSDKTSRKSRLLRYIKGFYESIGFDESFIEIISNKLNKVSDSDLLNIASTLEKIRKSIAEKASTKTGFIPYINYSKEFYRLIKLIEPFYPIQNELSGYNNGKNYQTFVPPSYLGDLIDRLSNGTDDEIRAFIKEEFGQSFQTAIFNKEGNVIGFNNSWLDKIFKNPDLGRKLMHYVEVESQGSQYKDLTSAEYGISTFINYLAPMGFPGTSNEDLQRLKSEYKDNFARFRVPIMSDKSTSEYILFEKIGINPSRDAEQMKKEICKELYPMFYTELMRIKHTFENNLDIQFYNNPIPEEIKKKFDEGKLTLNDFRKKVGKSYELQDWVKGGLAFRNFDIIVSAFISNQNKTFTSSIIKYLNSKDNNSKEFKAAQKGIIDNFASVITEAIDNRLNTVFIPHIMNIGITTSQIIPLLRTIDKTSSEEEIQKALNNFFTEYYWNDFLASTNILNMTIIDQAFYKDAVAVQKRMAQIHSMTTRPDVEATFVDENGNIVNLSDGKQRVLIVEDEFAVSNIINDTKVVFESMANEEENEYRKAEYIKLSKEIPKKLSNINVTDGQAITTVSGMFKKYGMLYGISPKFKRAFDKIRTGYFTKEDIENFKEGIESDYERTAGIQKPFTFAKVNAGTAEDPLMDCLQIKDSEYMLALAGALLNTYSKKYLPESSPLRALYEIVEDSFYDKDGKWNGKGIDTIVFKSCVKMGAFKPLKDISKSANPREDIKKYLEDPHSIKEFDFDRWGKQQNVPDELREHEQDMGSQERVLSVADFDATDKFKVKGVNKELSYRDFLDDYFKLLEEDLTEGIDNLIEKFNIYKGYSSRVYKLSEYLKSQILKDSKFTFENFKAVSLNNGEFTIPIGDPSLSDKFLSSLYSEIKRNVNKEKMLGGPTVQCSCYGIEGLEIHINTKNKNIEYVDIAMTCPSDELESLLLKPDGSLMSVEEALEKKLITEDDLKAIITRIPTEDKYSILPCRVKFFLPRHSGDRVIFPKEITYLTGSDFDVDKGYIQLKYTKTAFGKLFSSQRRKNKIFEYQWAALTHPKSFDKMMNGQDFGFLADIAETIDPNFKSADLNMAFAESQTYFMEKNMYAKKLVAISAVHNVSHSMANFADLYIKIPDVYINGIRTADFFDGRGYFRIDKTYSDFDGSRISRTIASLLGASVDNAKELIVSTLGYNDKTANIFLTMVRTGIPIDFVCYLFANSTVKNLANSAKINKTNFMSLILGEIQSRIEKKNSEKDNKEKIFDAERFIEKSLETTDFTTENLKNNLHSQNEELTLKTLCLIAKFNEASEGIRRFTTIASLNSTKNAVGPDVFDTVKKEFTIKEILFEMKGKLNLAKDKSQVFPEDTYDKIIRNISYLKPLIECYTDIAPRMLKDNFMQYQAPFRGLLQHLAIVHNVKWSEISSKKLKNLFNQFCIYMASKEALDCSYSNRKEVLLNAPINFLKLRAKNNIENDFLSSLVISDRISKKLGIPNIYMKTAKLDSDAKDALSSSWAALVNTPETKKMSDLLVTYNIFRYGFRFSPTGFLNIAPNESKLKYGKEGDWSKMTNHKGIGDLIIDDYENFLMQYLRNNPYSSLVGSFNNIPKEEISWNQKNDGFSVSLDYVGDCLALKAKRSNNTIYIAIKIDKAKNKAYFKRFPTLGLNGQGFEYNSKEEWDKIKTVNTTENKKALLETLKYTKEALRSMEEDEKIDEDDSDGTTDNASRFLNAGREITGSKDNSSVFEGDFDESELSDEEIFTNLTDSDEFYEEALNFGATKTSINKITEESDTKKRVKLVNKMLDSFVKKLGEDKVNKSSIFTEVKETIKKFC